MGKPEDWSPKSIIVVCVVIPAMFVLSWLISNAEYIEKNVLACIFFVGVVIFSGNLVGYIRNKTIYGLHIILRPDANQAMRFCVHFVHISFFVLSHGCCCNSVNRLGGGSDDFFGFHSHPVRPNL